MKYHSPDTDTVNALAKKEDAVIAACEGLIQNHVSDGNRYNTPAKRKAELQRMLRYTENNVCYTYSRDAVKRLVPADIPTPDLDGLVDASGVTQGNDGEDQKILELAETGIMLMS